MLLDALAQTGASAAPVRAVKLADLETGMVLAAAARGRSGRLLVDAGHEITVALYRRLENFAALDDGIAEPLMVMDEAGVSAAAGNAPGATG